MGKKKNERPLLRAFAVFFMLTIPFLLWVGLSKKGIVSVYKMDLERQKYVDRIKKLKKVNKELMEEIRRLKKDPAYVEKVAKRELGLIKENEVIYRFEDLQEKDQKQNGKFQGRLKNEDGQ